MFNSVALLLPLMVQQLAAIYMKHHQPGNIAKM
jgi:hypothetical protein